ncbi:MAG: sugar ABC transporter permease [Treponema sp.]|jgi:raffinose/stachyose/melibiose transport system permease protein|nr:sugar ABC transporter permease [Treponema sp.]
MNIITRKYFFTGKKINTTVILFIFPAFVLYTIFVIIPSLTSIQLSFTNWDGISLKYRYIGLDNYIEILSSRRFWSAMWNTLLLTFIISIGENVLALALALALDKVRWFKGFFRSIFYIPVLISGVVSGFIWLTMYNWNFGIINSLLRQAGLESWAVNWIGEPKIVLYSLALTIIWKGAGYYMVIYLAGLQGIPKECLESAVIDGAAPWQSFWYITFPLLAGSITINLTLSLINGLKIFDQIVVMTNGGPGFASETITYLIYRVAFSESRQGFGTALAVILFMLIFILNAIQSKALRGREVSL